MEQFSLSAVLVIALFIAMLIAMHLAHKLKRKTKEVEVSDASFVAEIDNLCDRHMSRM